VRHALEQVLPTKDRLTDLRLHVATPAGKRKEVVLHARQIIGENRRYPLILLSAPSAVGA
jgi:hypothetical protein